MCCVLVVVGFDVFVFVIVEVFVCEVVVFDVVY